MKPAANFSVTPTYLCTNQAPYNTAVTTIQVDFTDLSTGLTPTGNSWIWDFDNSSHAILQNPSGVLYIIPGYYSPQLIVTNGAGCKDTIQLDSMVNVPGPMGIYSFDPVNGCHPLTVNFQGATTGGGLFYTWDFGDGNVFTQVNDTITSHTYTQDGVYHPYFYIGYLMPDSTVCKSVGVNPTSDTVVTVLTFMTVTIDSSLVSINEGDQALVHATVFDTTFIGGPPFTYSWTPAYDIVATGPDAILYVNNLADSAYYYCTVTNIHGCEATDSVLVIIIRCDSRSVIPNVFTPNGDQFNDTYHIEHLCPGQAFHFTIYNRWGTIVFESTDPYFHWDGKTTGGVEASEGTYYYLCQTARHEFHGFLELMRK
jgi:gliding motility-associated-like protein